MVIPSHTLSDPHAMVFDWISPNPVERQLTVKLQNAGAAVSTVMGPVGLHNLAVLAPSRFTGYDRRRPWNVPNLRRELIHGHQGL